jgi:positive phototaxis protein PixI
MSDLSSTFTLAGLESLFTEPAPVEDKQTFLRFQLSSTETALVTVDSLAAVVTIAPREILPVPHMPNCVLGIYNWREEMLWLVDLSCQLGFPPLFASATRLSTVMAIVIQTNGISLGLVVSQIHDIEPHNPRQLQPPITGLFPPKLLPYVKGYLIDDRSIVLDANALVQDPLLQVHQLN